MKIGIVVCIILTMVGTNIGLHFFHKSCNFLNNHLQQQKREVFNRMVADVAIVLLMGNVIFQ